jgi:hypothetical protein
VFLIFPTIAPNGGFAFFINRHAAQLAVMLVKPQSSILVEAS